MNDDDRFEALVLSGQIESAFTFVNDIERRRSHISSWRDWAENKRKVIEGGISALCEEHHRREFVTAKAMKLGDIWEPSPFPVELSGADRASRTDEPLFLTTPWINLPPSFGENSRAGPARWYSQGGPWRERTGELFGGR